MFHMLMKCRSANEIAFIYYYCIFTIIINPKAKD